MQRQRGHRAMWANAPPDRHGDLSLATEEPWHNGGAMRALLPCLLLLLACHSTSSAQPSGPGATTDGAPPNECVAQGFVCQTQAGCSANYEEVDDLFCGASGDYCCAPILSPDAATAATVADAVWDVARNVTPEGGPPVSDGAADAEADGD